MNNAEQHGTSMMALARKLWPVNRSLSGDGVRETLAILKHSLPELKVGSWTTGSKVFDWRVPMEWHVIEAYIITPSGERICDFHTNNLHLVGYSVPFEGVLSLSELERRLHSLPDQLDAVPYVTSYYVENWGFCISHRDRIDLTDGDYRIVVRTKLAQGVLNFGELFVQGITDTEILFSTYICHPSMANNELSGPVLATELAKKVLGSSPYYSYRFVFIPETIGSLAYMDANLPRMKESMLAGYVLTCVGDDRAYSYLPSRRGDTVADFAAKQMLDSMRLDYRSYSWLDRGSDERQYCSPGADLPICSVMRSKYGEYPEYHTSLDTLDNVVTASGLQGSFDFYSKLIDFLETQRYPIATNIGEPQLGKRALYPNISVKGNYARVKPLVDFLSMCDGTLSLSQLSHLLGMATDEASYVHNLALEHNLVRIR